MTDNECIGRLNELLTIVIPVKNEERNLPECLENISAFHYVVMVDSCSTDATRSIFEEASKAHATNGTSDEWVCLDFKWDGKFPKKRNWVLRNFKFKTPFVLFLDADERITDAWIQEATRVLSANGNADSGIDSWICYYDNWFMGRMLRHGDTMRKTAILRIGAGEYEKIEEESWSHLDMEIHEHLVVNGATSQIRSRLEHHDRRSLESYYAKHDSYADWEASRYRALLGRHKSLREVNHLSRRQRIKYGMLAKWYFAPLYFIICYLCKFGFLDGRPGLIFALGKMRYFQNIRRKIHANQRVV